jgi:DNA polymerase-1
MEKLFLIIDGHALIYRSYFAMPPLTDTKGRVVGAVFGFAKTLLLALRDFEPDYISVVFDHRKASQERKNIYPLYKANRPPMPEDLRPQIDLTKKLVGVFNIPKFELEGLEGDDLIGFLSAQANKELDLKTTIVTGDKDLLQLVDEKVRVFIPDRSRKHDSIEYTPKLVKKYLDIYPNQVVDYKALRGDPSDNIPGVLGVGKKTALKLIHEFSTIEKLYEELPKIQEEGGRDFIKGKLLEKLVNDKEKAFLSYKLAKIKREAPFDFDLEKCLVSDYDKEEVTKLFDELGFQSLKKNLPKDKFDMAIEQSLF